MAKKNALTRAKKKKALAFFQQNNFNEALPLFQKICKVDRTDVESWFMLGTINGMQGNLSTAENCFRHVTQIQPNHAEAFSNLGLALEGQGKSEQAIKSFEKVLQLNSATADTFFNMANTLESLARYDESIECYQKANTLQPNEPDILTNLGHVLQQVGKYDEAVEKYQQAIIINPAHASAYNNLGTTRKKQRQQDKAIAAYSKAIEIKPNYQEAQRNLCGALLDTGKIDEALKQYERLISLNPDNSKDFSSYLFTSNNSALITAEKKYQSYLQFEKQYAERFATQHKPHTNLAEQNRKLKVGYVSADLYNHSVAFFLEPILSSYDKSMFEIYCYSDTKKTDMTTEHLKAMVEYWRDITEQSDGDVAELIRKDGIDILVDLSGHTVGNRLLVFARKPAPVQVTYLGYPNTTGLSAIDYRLTDHWADPEGQQQYHSEKLIHLEKGFLCYRPPENSPDVSSLPAAETGYITFGSFNNLSKMVSEVVELWTQILKQIPSSRLIVKNLSFRDESIKEDYYAQFAQHGIEKERIELIGWLPKKEDHLKLYSQIDIGLDTFPYNGTTTTCEAFWMGVPIIGLAGQQHAARVGVSLLNQIGLEDWIATSTADYIEQAIKRASELNELAVIRSTMRDRLLKSSLCNETGFTQSLEKQYQIMWDTWCD